jgi:uncharacterized damage-inducible protein DinB
LIPLVQTVSRSAEKRRELYTKSGYAYGMPSLEEVTLQALRVRITQVLPMQVRASIEAIPDDKLWWRPNEGANSAGNLVLHLAGSVNHYLNLGIGGIGYQRDRDGEFAARGPMSKGDLLRTFDEMIANAEKTLGALSPERLAGPSADPERYTQLVEDLINVATHFATHTGQIIWIAKAVTEGALREEWMRAHKRGGAWKR